VQLESPIAGVVAARNEAIMEDPGLLARNAECVDGAWLVEVDGDADELEDLPERLPT
jgi:glycine cleavage system H lipoate-binding protein